jgi:hypothetical protein
MCHLWLDLTTWLLSPNDHNVNPTSHISHIYINDYNLPWLSCKRHSPRFNMTHGSCTKCHMSQYVFKPKKYIFFLSNQILPHASFLT